MTEAFVGVGSNIEPERNLVRALELLAGPVRVVGVSNVYRTQPIDRPEQSPFLNCVWRVETALPARQFKFDVLRPMEAQLGRVRGEDPYADRSIDLDIVLFGDEVIDESDLCVPDPDIRTRPFILIPLLELDPALTMPDTGEPLVDMVSRMDCGAMEVDEETTARLRGVIE